MAVVGPDASGLVAKRDLESEIRRLALEVASMGEIAQMCLRCEEEACPDTVPEGSPMQNEVAAATLRSPPRAVAAVRDPTCAPDATGDLTPPPSRLPSSSRGAEATGRCNRATEDERCPAHGAQVDEITMADERGSSEASSLATSAREPPPP
jgi:hypothetical protein